jgi:hypothetical protein
MIKIIKKIKAFFLSLVIGATAFYFMFDIDLKYLSNIGFNSIEKENQSIVGVWRNDDSVIEIDKSGGWLSKIHYGISHKSTNARIQSVHSDKIRVGFSVIGTYYKTNGLPEQLENGKWVWEIDGKNYERTGDRLPASERTSIIGKNNSSNSSSHRRKSRRNY